jgi:hypothetical protein
MLIVDRKSGRDSFVPLVTTSISKLTKGVMGLDMRAVRRVYVKQWDHQSDDERYAVNVARGGKPVQGIQSDRIAYIEEEVMVWRKANQIHKWFVDNVQDDNDDCGTYYVPWQKLEALFLICETVVEASKLVDGGIEVAAVHSPEHPNGKTLRVSGKVIEDATVANELLPTCKGFFFGSQEYDQSYLQDVEDTRQFAGRVLAEHQDGVPGDIHYQSSW